MTADTQQRAIGLPVIKESANHGPLTSAAEGVAFHDVVSRNGSTQNLIPPAAVCRQFPPSAWVVLGYAVQQGVQYRATGGTLWGRPSPRGHPNHTPHAF